jgi:hypothetical protein
MSTEDSISKIAAAAQKLFTILNPLSPEGRNKAIMSAMAIFGETPSSVQKLNEPDKKLGQQDSPAIVDGICPKGVSWMKKNQITQEQLEHVFSIDGDAIDIIASEMPAKERKEQVVQAYVLCGLAIFLKNGELGFSDKVARELCEKTGCYNNKGHAKSFKNFGNFITGPKDSIWKLTNPGLVEGAKIIKLLTSKVSE